MVLRKNEDLPRPLTQAANNPPYPTTPSEEHLPPLPTSPHRQDVYSPDLNKSPAFQLRPLDEAQKPKDKDDGAHLSDEDWEKSDDETSDDLPDPLKIRGGKPLPAPAPEKNNSLPDVLKAGPPKGMPIRKPLEKIEPEPTGATSSSYASTASAGSIPLKTNNPYLKMQQTGQSNFGAESSQSVWGDTPAHTQSYTELAELPSYQTPDTPTNPISNHMANLQRENHGPAAQNSEQPSQPPLIAVDAATPLPSPSNQISNASLYESSMDAFERIHGRPETQKYQGDAYYTPTEQKTWEQRDGERKQHESAAAQEAAASEEQNRRHGESFAASSQAPGRPPPAVPSQVEEEPEHRHEDVPAPALPPRPSQEEQPPPLPLRPLQTAIAPSASTGPDSPNTVMNKQRKETYQIKHIRWYDVNKRSIRTSPILTQKINGPCPLLALVNALVLSTPAEAETALVETLRTREQVSLGLLLDAVFDELMSGRRGDAAQELPDVSDLYKFLLALHTGLNVNPMFVQDPEATDGTSTSTRPGVFENTRDMRLYKTFNLPLMHGWLPEPGSDAYHAFERIAKTYETSQYVQFQQEELEAKLESDEALTADEQQMFTDIHAIKEFLALWPTQLTTYGLKAMREILQPGQVAILFRNDHFSTLYKDPRTDHLVTLVTDQGYSSHDEIVWESLVDVNGQGSELFSGDFRPVGNSTSLQGAQTQQPMQSMVDVRDDQGWTTVQRRGNQTSSSSGLVPPESAAPLSPGSDVSRVEQEDHDLALALQLQEEEDQRHRQAEGERRRRENQLSENAISEQAQSPAQNRRTSRPAETPPTIPPRRTHAQTHQPAEEPAPPPTYEEAATNPPYHPPHGHPASNAPFRPHGSGHPMNVQQGGRGYPRPTMQNPMRPGRQSGMVGPNPNTHEGKDKCVVM